MKINTVNVIEYYNGTIKDVHAFTDDPEGNKQADKLFVAIAIDQERFSDEDIEGGLDDGWLSHGDWELYIVNSNTEWAA